MSLFSRVFLMVVLCTRFAFAQDPSTACLLSGPSYQLASDTVEWSMTVPSGQSCIRGVRSAFVTLDSIELVTPPKDGRIILEGPGFVYKGNSDFHGEDSFVISVSGKLNRVSGSSMIHIMVSVK